MDDFEFVDALTGDLITQNYQTGELSVAKGAQSPGAESVFFPGCSMINYAMPLVQAVYGTLCQHGLVDGISLLCCGKILSYEPDGDAVRASFERQLCERVAALGVKRFVCACPNCVKALREAFALDERTSGVELLALPQVLSEVGYRVDPGVMARQLVGEEGRDVLLCVHDSCPDRDYGQFADGLRAILPEGQWADPAHCRRRSVCCGSLPRAAGNAKAADRCADICGRDAADVHADAIVTACMSCAFQLNMAQAYMPAVHFLELLYDWRINWAGVGAWMKVRFLFDETLGVTERPDASGRTYAGLGGAADSGSDAAAAQDVSLSQADAEDVGE